MRGGGEMRRGEGEKKMEVTDHMWIIVKLENLCNEPVSVS